MPGFVLQIQAKMPISLCSCLGSMNLGPRMFYLFVHRWEMLGERNIQGLKAPLLFPAA